MNLHLLWYCSSLLSTLWSLQGLEQCGGGILANEIPFVSSSKIKCLNPEYQLESRSEIVRDWPSWSGQKYAKEHANG